MSEDEERLKKSDHHALARSLHDHSREKDNVVSALSFGIGNSAAQGIGLNCTSGR